MIEPLLGVGGASEICLRRASEPGWVLLLIFASALLALLLYRREPSLSRGRGLLLAGLRSLAYAALILLLFEPTLLSRRDVLVPGNVLVLLDVSESMGTADPRRSLREAEDAALALGEIDYVLPRIQGRLHEARSCLAALGRPGGVEGAGAPGALAERALEALRAGAAEARVADAAAPAGFGPGSLDALADRIESFANGFRTRGGVSLLPDTSALAVARGLAEEASGILESLATRLPPLDDGVRERIAQATRFDLARGVLGHPDLDLFRAPGQSLRLRFFRFGQRLEPENGEGEALLESLLRASPTASATRLGDAIQEAADRYSGQVIGGVILLTDGASNEGLDPLEVARKMKERSVPLFPVGLGTPTPDDVGIERVIVQDTVFVKDRVPVKVELSSRGYDGRTVDVVVSLEGREVGRRAVSLAGGRQYLQLDFVPEGRSGTGALEVEVAPLEGEISARNNVAKRAIEIIDEKIRVLYVEGRPRWEYRYLRAILLRDERLRVTFLLTDGDPDLARSSPGYIARFPEEPSESERFDLVILGDVPSYYFTPAQQGWVADLVRKHGGSLLYLPGTAYGPATFRDSPIADVLPTRFGEGWLEADPAAHPLVTSAGMQSLMVQLEETTEGTAAAWSLVRPLYRLPRSDGPKPGANVLVTLPDGGSGTPEYPLVAWHRYGTGKCLLVATDQLWRLRYLRGDTYHARFWGQAIRFLTLSRLLGENKRIHLETDRKEYRAGERVEVYANVLTETYDPFVGADYGVEVESPGGREVRRLSLDAVPGVPGLFHGSWRAEVEGRHVVRIPAADGASSRPVEIVVEPASRESLVPDMQEGTLRAMAELSGGRYLGIRDLPALPELVEASAGTLRIEEERELWDEWAAFVAILTCVGIEWFLRRRSDLA